jgi:hypothetical protein
MTQRFERTSFFDGQLLSAADFHREQQYLLDRQRRHNRYAHGWGVLAGLEVRIEGSDIVVAPGIAIDCEGNEVELVETQRLAIGSHSQVLFVGIVYAERPGTAVPVPGSEGVAHATLVEDAAVELSAVNACAGHAGHGPGTAGCGQRHAVVLARVRPHRGGWQVRAARCRT